VDAEPPAIPAQRVEDDILGDIVECVRMGAQPRRTSNIGRHIAEQQMMADVSSREKRAIPRETTYKRRWDREPGIMDLSGGYC
jgi:hypothetical protein